MIVSSTDIRMGDSPKPLPMKSNLKSFFGDLPENRQWIAVFYGPAFSGKSTGLMKLCGSLAKPQADILYNLAEEPIDGGTIKSKLLAAKTNNPNLWFNDDQNLTIDKLSRILTEKQYDLCITDSLTVLAESRQEIKNWLLMCRTFPHTSFIFVSHADKTSKTYIGASLLRHIPGIMIKVENGVMIREKNRYCTAKHKITELNIFKV